MAKTERDPVCNMEVSEQDAVGRSQYQGQTYYFCSSSCKQKFDQNPQQYATQGQKGAGKSASTRH
jgi:Cu+-exporting ATPase